MRIDMGGTPLFQPGGNKALKVPAASVEDSIPAGESGALRGLRHGWAGGGFSFKAGCSEMKNGDAG
ncbi:MAG: hypothetical protein K1X78_22305 [Verrucomicrobiaceae bacterium]|nr:hypothetical protein [Verrucomicrobiaceae bacterium]